MLAYINTGAGDFTFERQIVYAAPHPNWGSSGFELVDLDKDGDLDVLLTHGDTFDDGIVKPYRGIQWLENRGGYPFVDHTIAPMPGVHRAQAADLDGDGDLDIVASALLAGGSDVDEKTLPALAWLEQTAPGTFTRHTIAMGFPGTPRSTSATSIATATSTSSPATVDRPGDEVVGRRVGEWRKGAIADASATRDLSISTVTIVEPQEPLVALSHDCPQLVVARCQLWERQPSELLNLPGLRGRSHRHRHLHNQLAVLPAG